MIDVAHAEAREILVAHRATLDRLAAALVERETLEAEELTEVFEGVSHVTDRPAAPAPPAPVWRPSRRSPRSPCACPRARRRRSGPATRWRSLRSRLAGWLETGTPTP